MVWNQLDRIQSPAIVTSDFVYLRLIGDRSIKEGDFGMIQKDRIEEMKYWADKFRTVEETEKEVKIGIVAANNHYAGFGAATANMFRVMKGLIQSNGEYERKSIMFRKHVSQWALEYTNQSRRHCLIIPMNEI